MDSEKLRIVKDSMGTITVPADAYYGAQTQRAAENFKISGIRFHANFIKALGLIKKFAADVNLELKKLDREKAKAIISASNEVIEGNLDDNFIVEIFQTGSGTSTNMNANEVIANRANKLSGFELNEPGPIHPNDHVNMGQSSNDVIPTAIHISVLESIKNDLLIVLNELKDQLKSKSKEFNKIIKIGRTHLQDATPMTLGQEFSGYAGQIKHSIERITKSLEGLKELPLGGTAVGTGINTDRRFAKKVIEKISKSTGIKFKEAENHFEAQASRDALVFVSASLRGLAISLMKIANDIRWLGSGPRCGIGELIIPSVQPGSSIMPGKVNPVISEAVIQVCAQVIGYDSAVAISGFYGSLLELNVMMPLIAYNVLESVRLLSSAVRVFSEKMISGLKVDKARCSEMVEKSLAIGTRLTPYIGYDATAEIVNKAYISGKTIREVVIEKNIFNKEKIDEILNPGSMIKPD